MSWKIYVNLITSALVEVSEPDPGQINYLFKFKKDGIPTLLETTGDWGVLKEGSYVDLEISKYRCQQGKTLVTGPEKKEFSVRSQICSAETEHVLINGKPSTKKQ